MPERPDFDRLGDLLPAAAGGSPHGAGGDPRPQPATGTAPPAGPASDEEASRRVSMVWADEVGPEIAGNARPVQLRGGRLVVTTSSSAWAQTLQNMAPLVVERLNRRLGVGTVEKAVFRHAGWDPAWNAGSGSTETALSSRGSPPRGKPGPGSAGARRTKKSGSPAEATAAPAADALEGLTAEELEALADVDRLPLPPAVRRTIRQAMIADFVRDRQDSGRC